MWRIRVPGLTMDEQHRYYFNGVRVPGVTTILRGKNFNPTAQMLAAMDRGKAVHLATQYHDEGRLNPESVAPELVPYFEAYLKFLAEVKPEIIHVEQMVIHHQLWYAGTLDRVVKINGVEGVLDLKTGSAPMHTGPQIAAYYEAMSLLRGMTGGHWSLVLFGDGTYTLNPYKGTDDWEMFKASLVIYRWKEARR